VNLEGMAMIYVIEKLAPDPGRSLAGVILQSAASIPGVTVHVDWPVFLGRPAEEIDRMYADRLAWLRTGELWSPATISP